LRNSQTVGLHGRELRKVKSRNAAKCAVETGCGEAAEVIQSAEIYSEVSGEGQVVCVCAELKAVVAARPGHVVGFLVALFGAVHKGEWLTAEEGEARDIDRNIASAGSMREIVEQSAAGILEAEFVDDAVAKDPGMLRCAGDIAVGLLRGSRESILPEVLVL